MSLTVSIIGFTGLGLMMGGQHRLGFLLIALALLLTFMAARGNPSKAG